MSSNRIAFFVHECMLESGHTRAMLEVLRAVEINKISELHLIYFEGSTTIELLPEFNAKIVHHQVPAKWLFPFLFKAIFFQIYTFFLTRYILPTDCIKIGIGTACLNIDIVNIQFIQSQWKPLYFKNLNIFSPRVLYKKVLFFYFTLCENYLYRKEDLKFMSLSKFITSYLEDEFQVLPNHISTIYSSTNLDHFPIPSNSKEEVLDHLGKSYPSLKDLDLNLPIFLFIGAFERKGLLKVLSDLKHIKGSQLIIIGKPERGSKVNLDLTCPKIIKINFTKELSLFYELSDIFFFPTIYEPFGLVVAEAAAMGNTVLVPKLNVGASEIFYNLKSINFIDEQEIDIANLKKLTVEEKIVNAKEVRARLKCYSWEAAAKSFEKILLSFSLPDDKAKH